MPIDLTPVARADMMVNRLELLDGVFPILEYNDDISGWTELVTFDPSDGWSWDLQQLTGAGAVPKNYLKFRIIDEEGLKDLLDQGSAISYGGMRYKVSRETRPVAVPLIWQLRLDYIEDVSPS